jgi:hypothetical protein
VRFTGGSTYRSRKHDDSEEERRPHKERMGSSGWHRSQLRRSSALHGK